jgi:hypothetical protein
MKNNLLHSTTVIRQLTSETNSSEELLFHNKGCFVKLINLEQELSTLENYEGAILLIVGNPFLKPTHSKAIWNLLRLDNKEEFMQWMKDIYDAHRFGHKENILLQLDYTCRFLRSNTGYWRLFLPSPNYYVGGPDQPDQETFWAAGDSLRKWLEKKAVKLYPNG